MHKKLSGGRLAASALALWCCGSAAALAQEPLDARPPGPELLDGPGGGPELPPLPSRGAGGDRMFLALHGPGPGAGGPPQEVIHTLMEMERLYREQGRNKEVVALYQDVLGRTRDPLVRHFAYEAIVRAQLQPADTDKALATLRQSLDDSLQRLNQMPPPAKGDKP